MTTEFVLSLFTDHTFRLVILGSAAIGLAAAVLGCFAYLRRQSLIADVISHSALPGAMGSFLVMAGILGLNGRSMYTMLPAAAIAGTLAVLLSQLLARTTRLRIDAAMACVLSIFFGLGMLLMRVISDGPFPGKGGVHTYLFGNAATLTIGDVQSAMILAVAAIVLVMLLWKVLIAHSLDAAHTQSLGFSSRVVDVVVLTAIAVAVVIGMRSVGLVLMVACVISPAAAARQWVRTSSGMVVLAGVIGAIGSAIGAIASIGWRMSTGPIVVLALFVIVLFSLIAAPRRGILATELRRRRLRATGDASGEAEPGDATVGPTAAAPTAGGAR